MDRNPIGKRANGLETHAAQYTSTLLRPTRAIDRSWCGCASAIRIGRSKLANRSRACNLHCRSLTLAAMKAEENRCASIIKWWWSSRAFARPMRSKTRLPERLRSLKHDVDTDPLAH